jgi:hypothetical protein
MDIWATVVHTVDPASSRLPSIRNPVAVGNSLLVLTICMLLGALFMTPSIAQAIQAAGAPVGDGWVAARGWWDQLPRFSWALAMILGLAGVWAIWTLAPPRGAEPHGPVWDDIWRLLVGYCGWVVVAAMLADLSAQQSATSRHPRLVLALAAGAFAGIGLLGLRGVFRLIGQRSREYRRMMSSRQSVDLLMLAVGGAVFGQVMVYLSRFTGGGRLTVSTLGSVLLAACMLMLIIGLAYLVLNAWWIRQALRRPPPNLDEVLQPRMPNETWALDRED